MYDMTQIKRRYFIIKLINGKVLNVEPPKMKVLKKITSLSDVEDKNNVNQVDIENLISALSLALSKNKENYKISDEWIEENVNFDDTQELLKQYFEWVGEIYNLKN